MDSFARVASSAALVLVSACAAEPEGDGATTPAETSSTTDGDPTGDGDGDGDPTGDGDGDPSGDGDGDGDPTGDGDGDPSGDGDGDGGPTGDGDGDPSGDGDGDPSGCATPVHANDFDDDSLGPYADLDDWNSPPWASGIGEGRVEIIEGPDAYAGRSLRIHYPQGGVGPSEGGAQWRLELDDSYAELYLAYRIRFAPGFDFVKGGKIPGLVGGTAPTGCVDDDTGFSARGMWRTEGHAVQYMYWPDKVANCGDDYDYMLGDQPLSFTPGQWHLVEHHLRMNTPGVADGVLEAWVDGEQVLAVDDFLYRTADYDYEIDAMYFSTFFGGSGDDWAPSQDETVDFDDFVLCEAPITH